MYSLIARRRPNVGTSQDPATYIQCRPQRPGRFSILPGKIRIRIGEPIPITSHQGQLKKDTYDRMLAMLEQLEAEVDANAHVGREHDPDVASSRVDPRTLVAEAGGAEGEFKTAQEAFRAEFKKANGVEVQIYAPYVYDAVMVMADAMKRAKSADPKVYLPELAKTANYKGLTGMLSFDAKGDLKQPSLSVYTYKGGHRSLSEVVH